MATRKRGTIYIGVTSDLNQRVYDHQEGRGGKFTKTYSVRRLVWYETHDEIEVAIQREKNLKRWYRAWKIDLIESTNPGWFDLGEITSVAGITEWVLGSSPRMTRVLQ